MFFRLADIASFEARAMRRGRDCRICAFAAIVTGVSVIPDASFASVFPVQGQIISASSGVFGPSGSASAIVVTGAFLQISDISRTNHSAVTKRVSVVKALKIITGSRSYQRFESEHKIPTDFFIVQNDPQKAYPITEPPPSAFCQGISQ